MCAADLENIGRLDARRSESGRRRQELDSWRRWARTGGGGQLEVMKITTRRKMIYGRKVFYKNRLKNAYFAVGCFFSCLDFQLFAFAL